MQVDESKLHQQVFDEAAHDSQLKIALSAHKSDEKARGAIKTTIEEIEDESLEEQRSRQKTNLHILFHIDDKESADSDIVKEKVPSTKHPTTSGSNPARKVTVKEVEDEALKAHHKKPKSPKHLLEALDDFDDPKAPQEASANDMTVDSVWGAQRQALDTEIRINGQDNLEVQILEVPLPPPPKDKLYCLQKKCFTPAGTSALKVLVLSTRGWVGNLENGPVDLWLDSCTDVTWISEDFFKLLKGAPKE